VSEPERMLGELYVAAGSHLVDVDGHRVLGSVRVQLSRKPNLPLAPRGNVSASGLLASWGCDSAGP